jgi:DNA-binding transcriptional regulator YhcF (GntR family)
MSAKYWIKLYHEILHDPKMARMNDTLWRRTIELFLMAGETDRGGALPAIEDMAWQLRINPAQLQSELSDLQNVGIISTENGEYLVSRFSERQEPMKKAEYMQRRRDTKQKQEHYQSVTNGNADTDTDTDTDKTRKEKKRKEPPVFAIPVSLDTPAFLKSWNDWKKYKSESKKKFTASTISRQLALLEKHPPGVAIAMIEQSIERGWQGLFDLKDDAIIPQPVHPPNGKLKEHRNEAGELYLAPEE